MTFGHPRGHMRRKVANGCVLFGRPIIKAGICGKFGESKKAALRVGGHTNCSKIVNRPISSH